jgi:hypothetical protein
MLRTSLEDHIDLGESEIVGYDVIVAHKYNNEVVMRGAVSVPQHTRSK